MTAAIGIVFSFMSFIQAIGFWFGYGSGNIMSKKIGENEEREAEIISSIGILFAIVIGILIAILSWFFVLPLSKFIGGSASESLLNFTVQYLKVIIVSIPFGLYSITLYNQLRLCGNVKDGMIGLLIGIEVFTNNGRRLSFKMAFLFNSFLLLLEFILQTSNYTFITVYLNHISIFEFGSCKTNSKNCRYIIFSCNNCSMAQSRTCICHNSTR